MANASTYTDEYRLECADYVISSGKTATEVAKELGLYHKTLQHWVKMRRDQLDGKAPGKQEPDEVRELRKRVRDLEQENQATGGQVAPNWNRASEWVMSAKLILTSKTHHARRASLALVPVSSDEVVRCRRKHHARNSGKHGSCDSWREGVTRARGCLLRCFGG